MTLHIVVADDHLLFRDGLVGLLRVAKMQVIGEAGDGQTAVDLALSLHPDLVLLDLNMPVMSGLDALRQIKRSAPEIQVVILTVSDYEEHLVEAIREGASGYLLKNVDSKTFLEALAALQRGEGAISRKSVKVLMDGLAQTSPKGAQEKPPAALTDQEIEILRLIAKGHSNAAIAEQVSLSENTVKYHIKNILRKLDVHNRTEAIHVAMSKNLF
jgi:two-component system nitrate/nitrite response regulator NarL